MKPGNFVAITNFTVWCTGYVSSDASLTTAEGFLIDIIPKPTGKSTGDDGSHIEERYGEQHKLYKKFMASDFRQY